MTPLNPHAATLARVAAIEARVRAATSGPWTYHPRYGFVEADSAGQVCQTFNRNDADFANAKHNGEFVAEARDDVPWLCAQLRAALGEGVGGEAEQIARYAREQAGTVPTTARGKPTQFGKGARHAALKIAYYAEQIIVARAASPAPASGMGPSEVALAAWARDLLSRAKVALNRDGTSLAYVPVTYADGSARDVLLPVPDAVVAALIPALARHDGVERTNDES